MLPGVGYLGNKSASGVFQAIIAAMPPHDTYIEPYLGSGVVLAMKPPAVRSIGCDLSSDALAIATARLTYKAELICTDAIQFLEDFDFAAAGRVLIYCDPPYLPSVRAPRGHRYPFDYDENDHKRLLYRLQLLPAAVMVSGYQSPLYDSLLDGWRSIEFQSMTRGGVRTEKLWCNFPADQVHWATFAGRNFTRRQNIKRLAARWAANYIKRPHGERLAILAAMLAAESRPDADAPMPKGENARRVFGQPDLPLSGYPRPAIELPQPGLAMVDSGIAESG